LHLVDNRSRGLIYPPASFNFGFQEARMGMPASIAPINEAKLNAFMGRAVGDMGAAMHAVLILLGDRLGLYKAMADSTPVTPAELAKRTGTTERYVREWLNANAASGYITYDAATATYTLPPEQALALAMDDSPAFLPGIFQIISSCFHDADKIEQAFLTGKGVGWHEHHHDLFHGTERFFRPGYLANLTTQWIPALDGVEAKLRSGAKVADVGCGLGASTIVMAKEFPKSEFFGFDYHAGSIDMAREAAQREGVADRVTFAVASAKAFPGKGYDFVAFFDCLHNMGDPVGAAAPRTFRHQAGRDVDDRRAVCGGRHGGQSQSGGTCLLFGFHLAVRACIDLAGGWSGARRAGGREAHPGGRHQRRIPEIPPRHPDAVQPGARGETLTSLPRPLTRILRELRC
jgi:SAM-dependent methyltransferase